jgi:MFS family permease
MILALIFFIIKVKEPKFVAEMEETSKKYGIDDSEDDVGGDRKMSRAEMRSLIFILMPVVFWFMGYNAATSKFAVYATDVLNTGYSKPLLVAQGAAIISYLPIGMLASKFGRKKTILLGIVELFTAFVLATFTTSETAFLMYVVMALAGIGWATINVNSYPMVVEMAKSGNVGKYTGIYYTASMSAQILTPILSGMLMDAVSMHALFPYCAVFCALAFLTMSFVKHGDAKAIPAGKSKQEIFEETINALDD